MWQIYEDSNEGPGKRLPKLSRKASKGHGFSPRAICSGVLDDKASNPNLIIMQQPK